MFVVLSANFQVSQIAITFSFRILLYFLHSSCPLPSRVHRREPSICSIHHSIMLPPLSQYAKCCHVVTHISQTETRWIQINLATRSHNLENRLKKFDLMWGNPSAHPWEQDDPVKTCETIDKLGNCIQSGPSLATLCNWSTGVISKKNMTTQMVLLSTGETSYRLYLV